MHTDASVKGHQSNAAIGIVMRDRNGMLVAVQNSSTMVNNSPLEAEAMAILEGLCLARRLKVDRLTILSDSLTLIKTINEEMQGDACIAATVWEIKTSQKSFRSLNFHYISRKFNVFAHRMARLGLSSSPCLWVQNYPAWMLTLSLQERSLFVSPMAGGSF